ncbi:MAG TPA: Asp-tRNA(Asn)/Glu-tRNA(Gln) amidotransferase subunit GatC [Candidatus Omnitrophota bacterium]|nr:Asp-tRNA(Asn)/Glu-tRNA(Gln) amidotransferase subunit GatC [Candidatus Omnitrophota bacterium]HSA31811.1 Asp-tRNA(Asn)/Glu-tRNA(Gln) amidotransferase subunit GatC [Candidatus Omnitrophota bacterium]
MITNTDLQYISALARMSLAEEELKPMAEDLSSILDYIAQLQKLDVTDIKPTSHVLPLKNVYRDDSIKPSLTQEKALSFAISKAKGAFKVPQIVDN